MNQIVNSEDPLSEFEMTFLDFFTEDPTATAATTTTTTTTTAAQDIANETPSLFVNANADLDFDINNWTSAESTTTSLANSPANNFKLLSSKNTLLASPLQDYNELCPSMSHPRLDRKHSRNLGSDIFTYDYTTNKPSNTKYRVNKPSSSSPLMRLPLKPSVTIASIDTLSRLDVKSSAAAIPKTNVGNPFYKSPMETKPKMITTATTTTTAKNSQFGASTGAEESGEDDDSDEEQVIYDLLVDNNITSITSQYPMLETKFKTFDDYLIFDALLDNSQQPQPSIQDNIPWRV
ncbi:hypothetical protein Cantr_08382 [Candida viswanathii]|uniref:Uncharacterized protein n=1 Tax=Candida viswanathii TaxID=5486 RepID=A0A367Y573_9ASCO|nr:hypothetical protein Cantr_08382 [Candida viswanathii]